MSFKDELFEDPSTLWILGVVLICLLALPFALRWEDKQKVVRVVYDAPEFSFTNSIGRKTSLSDLKGRVWLADFVLIRCTTQCPLVTSAMADLQKKWKSKGLQLVSFTLDSDGYPDALKQYAKNAGADPSDWVFLTGKNQMVIDLARNGFHLPDIGDFQADFIHSSRIALVDAQGHIEGYFDGMNQDDLKDLNRKLNELFWGKS